MECSDLPSDGDFRNVGLANFFTNIYKYVFISR